MPQCSGSGSPYLNGKKQINPSLQPACQRASSLVIPPQVFAGQPTEAHIVSIIADIMFSGFVITANALIQCLFGRVVCIPGPLLGIIRERTQGCFLDCLATYPLSSICGRMMMTCGEGVKYKSSVDAFSQILKKGGV